MRTLIITLLGAALLVSACAPSAYYFNVDVKDKEAVELPLEERSVAVLAVYEDYVGVASRAGLDSVNCTNAAMGIAEKIEDGYSKNRGSVLVYSVPESEALSEDYIQYLLVKTGAQVFVVVRDMKFYNPRVYKVGVMGAYDNANVIVPFSLDVSVVDGITNSSLYNSSVRDSVYMQVLPSVIEEDRLGSTITGYMPQISKGIGNKTGAMLSPKWETQTRMLISYVGERGWESAYLLSQEFKWKEAIEIWMVLARSENPKRRACAAYNIAVGCEMLEQFDLALKWAELSIKNYKFQEAVDMCDHLKSISGQTL